MLSGESVTTDYVKPFGYSIPPLRQGKVVASLNLFYEREPVDFLRNDQRINQNLSSALQLNGYDISDATHSFYWGEGYFICGLSDNSTAAIRINIAPDQSSNDKTITGRYFNVNPTVVHTRDQSVNAHAMQVRLEGKLANRPSAGLELSLGMNYDVNRSREKSAAVLGFNDYGPSAQVSYQTSSATRQMDWSVVLGVATLSDGSNLKSYLPPSGYLLPILAKGQFGVYGEGAYSVGWGKETDEVEVLGYHSAETAVSWRAPQLRLKFSFLYGLFGDATILLSLEYGPAVTQGRTGLTNVDLNNTIMERFTGVFRQEILLAGLAVAYRPVPGVEISSQAAYSDDRRPSNGKHSPRLLFDDISTMRHRLLTVRAGIAMLVL